MKIVKKITLNNIIASLIIIMISATFIFVGSKTMTTYSDFYNIHFIPLDNLRKIQLIYREIDFRLVAVPMKLVAPIGTAEFFKNAVIEIDTLWEEVDDVIPREENKIERESIIKGHGMFKVLIKDLNVILQNEEIKEMYKYYDKWLNSKVLIVKSIDKYVEDQTRSIYASMASQKSFLTTLIIAIAVSASIIVILFILFSISFVKSIKNPLDRSTSLLRNLAAGDGDLTISVFHKKIKCSDLRKCGCKDCKMYGTENNNCMIEVGSFAAEFGNDVVCPAILSGKLKSCVDCVVMKILIKDEIDELSFSADMFVRKIREMIVDIKEVALALSTSAGELSSQSENFSNNAQSQAASIEEISASIENVTSREEHAGSTMLLFNELVDHIMSKLSRSVESANNSASKMQDALNSRNVLNLILKKVQDTNKEMTHRMNEAKDVAKRTKDIIQSVTDISEQINLLSLNAAIEAARAGEQGRGFAVVADEIGKLSDLTQENVKGITDKIENTSKVINLVNEDIFNVVDNIKTVIDEITKFGMMVEDINHMLELDNKIKFGIQGEAMTMRDSSDIIKNSMLELNSAVQEISKAIHSVNDIIQQNSSGAEEMSANTEETANIADKLKHFVDRFKI